LFCIFNNHEFTFNAEAGELEIIVLAFSLISWRFVTISGEPDFRMVSEHIMKVNFGSANSFRGY
jgi:hypothetical protein